MSMPAIIRSQVAAVLRREAAKYADEMLEIIADIARNRKAFDGDRLKAASMILDRAAGKPTQEVSDENFNPETIREQIRAAAEAADRVMRPALQVSSEKPLLTGKGEVITLRPFKVETSPVRRKIPRRRLVE